MLESRKAPVCPHSRYTDVTEANAPEIIAYHIKFLPEDASGHIK